MRNTVARCTVFAALVLPVPAYAGAPAPVACTAGRLELQSGSTADIGWTGLLHSAELVAGAAIGFDVVSRCSDDDSACLTNGDCESDLCVATCDCQSDTSCEIAGPLGKKRCLTTLETCSTDEDCPDAIPCVPFFAPPQPLLTAGYPLCAAASYRGPIEGQIESDAGEVSLSGKLNWRVFLGISAEAPCPRCGAPESDPEIGDEATCEGGQRDGLACTVHGVTGEFGGVSYDCAPTNASNVSGPGVVLPLFEMTTEATARTAGLPCSFFGFRDNPLDPETNPKCTDAREVEDPVCTSNADCLRCSENSSIACANNGDCVGSGVCAEAPAQPVTCGFWCHCGFCDGNASLPCMENADCPPEQECSKGTAFGNEPGMPQARPNDCAWDGFVCGTAAPETCETATCSLDPATTCTDNSDCGDGDGECPSPPSCFEPRIEREGSASPLGMYCAIESKPCSSNADCTQPDDFCSDDIALPLLAGISCMPGTSSAIFNSFSGVTGPVAFEWQTRLTMCGCEGSEAGCEEVCNAGPVCDPGSVCGDGSVDDACGEECDDGNTANGDGCSETCGPQTLCGDANEDGEILTSDAQRALQRAVGIDVECDLTVCDVDASGSVQTNDALRILRKAVELGAELNCDYTP